MNEQPLPPRPPQPPTPPASEPQKPAAYDSEGRPLYAAPQQPLYEQPATPQVVHLSRAVEPVKVEVTPEIKAKHEESKRRYPSLNLSEAEYVISAVRRHPIGLALPIGVTVFFTALIISSLINYQLIISSLGLLTTPDMGSIFVMSVLFLILIWIGSYIAIWVYMNNKFFLTNESVIQEIQVSVFSKHEQTVSLANIEDASFQQQGILQSIFNYGSIRLSTEGDETTYRFSYVASPKRQIAILNDAVEAFKNGRPMTDSDN